MATKNSSKILVKLFCEPCDYKCCRTGDFNKHLTTRKHLMTTSTTSKIERKLFCENCDYTCYNKCDFDKHLLTAKHRRTTELLSKVFACDHCNKEYKHHSSLWKHKNTCRSRDNIQLEIKPDDASSLKDVTMELIKSSTDDVSSLKEIIIELIKSNSDLQRQSQEFQAQQFKQSNELQKQVVELCKNGTNNNNTNCHNKFNINVFLNDKCKDAINLSDFIKNIEVSREDIQNTGRLGFVDGISKIIIDNLKQLDVTERPIHCTDVKRETMYIKDEDQWNKEGDDTKMRNVIQTVSRKSIKTLQEWKQVNPDYDDGDSEFSQDCLSMQRHSVAGDDREVYYPKVSKIVAKGVIVDKE